jgi:branched-chain amino acid aminotransferase
VKIGRGRRGPVTETIQQKFFQIVKGEVPDTHGWLQPVTGSGPVRRSA